ncbi:MAG: hypothetical protein V2B15_13570 [Bacteroidota bacterium]
MKKLFIILFCLLCIFSCEKKLSVTCNGDCTDPTFLVDGETGTDITYSNFTNTYTYNEYNQVSKIVISGTITYNDSGNSYQVEGVANQSPCNYTITVTDANGEQATCRN